MQIVQGPVLAILSNIKYALRFRDPISVATEAHLKYTSIIMLVTRFH